MSFQAYRTDPEVGRYQGWAVLSDEEAHAFLDEMSRAAVFVAGDWHQIAIADRATDQLIGDVGIRIGSARDAEIGFTLARGWQGRGLGREAVERAVELVFSCTYVVRILGLADVRNLSARRLLTSLGFQPILTRPSETRGQPSAEIVFERMRS